MEEALQRHSFPPPSPRPEIITIFITGRVSLRCIKCSYPPSPADPDTLFGRTRSTAPRSTTSSVERSSEWRFQVVMSNQRFWKIVCFRFPTNVPQKIEHIRFLKQNLLTIQNVLFQISKCEIQKAFSFFSFQIFFETSKRSVLVLEICELNQNVLLLFLSFWNK